MAPPSTQQPPPGRLQGLSGGSGGKPRFSPNVVGRRSREEREKTAPAVKIEQKETPPAKRVPTQLRRGRGGARSIGARAEAAGPLSAPSLAPSSSRTIRRVNSTAGEGDKSKELNLPSEKPSRTTTRVKLENGDSVDVDDEELSNRVNIADPDNAAGSFFPLRVPRDELQTDDLETPAINRGGFYLFQIPDLGFNTQNSLPESNDNEEEELKDTKFQDGRIGTLRKHASGRLSMKLGDAIFDVTPAAPSASVEEVILLKDGTRALRLGEINSKFVVVPEF